MKKRKNNEEETLNVDENEVVDNNTNQKEETKEVDTKLSIKKSIFYIFYIVVGILCLVLFILTFFSGPRDFIVDKTKILFGIFIAIYAILFLLPYTFKKKESALINVLTFIELGIIIIIGFIKRWLK